MGLYNSPLSPVRFSIYRFLGLKSWNCWIQKDPPNWNRKVPLCASSKPSQTLTMDFEQTTSTWQKSSCGLQWQTIRLVEWNYWKMPRNTFKYGMYMYLYICTYVCTDKYTRWFKYDRDYLCVNKSQFVPVIFEPPCTIRTNKWLDNKYYTPSRRYWKLASLPSVRRSIFCAMHFRPQFCVYGEAQKQWEKYEYEAFAA